MGEPLSNTYYLTGPITEGLRKMIFLPEVSAHIPVGSASLGDVGKPCHVGGLYGQTLSGLVLALQQTPFLLVVGFSHHHLPVGASEPVEQTLTNL